MDRCGSVVGLIVFDSSEVGMLVVCVCWYVMNGVLLCSV